MRGKSDGEEMSAVLLVLACGPELQRARAACSILKRRLGYPGGTADQLRDGTQGELS